MPRADHAVTARQPRGPAVHKLAEVRRASDRKAGEGHRPADHCRQHPGSWLNSWLHAPPWSYGFDRLAAVAVGPLASQRILADLARGDVAAARGRRRGGHLAADKDLASP